MGTELQAIIKDFPKPRKDYQLSPENLRILLSTYEPWILDLHQLKYILVGTPWMLNPEWQSLTGLTRKGTDRISLSKMNPLVKKG